MRFSDLLRREPKWAVTDRLDTAVAPGISQGECAQFLDAFQAEAYERLVGRYRDPTMARLFALKLTNLAAGRYHHRRRHSTLFSHPVLLMVDPANACQLGCPGCVHTANVSYAARFDWPRKTLPLETYQAFLDQYGPFAFSVALYNYGEPLLNKRFAEIVRRSRNYLLHTFTSTNLSMPLDDAEAIVGSGLGYMVLSIDGATQAVYERYRRGGNLELVLQNVRKLVAAKKALGSVTPCLVWQFLTFEHNVHELDDARRLAAEIGVNQFSVVTPFGVDADDPSIRPLRSPEEGTHVVNPEDPINGRLPSRVHDGSEAIERAFRKSWKKRAAEITPDPAASHAQTCGWLYFNMTMDGAGRIMPCCMAPFKQDKNLVFANFGDGESPSVLDVVNSPMARLARKAFADRANYEREAAVQPSNVPYCANCQEKPVPPYGMHNVRWEIRKLDPGRVISDELVGSLTDWK